MKTVTMYLSERGGDSVFSSQEEAEQYDAARYLCDALLEAMGGERREYSSDSDWDKAWAVAYRIAQKDRHAANEITQVLTKEGKNK